MPDELFPCEVCGHIFALDDLYEWEPPNGTPLRVCADCVVDMEMEL